MDGFTVLADPNRRRVLDALADGESDVGSLVERLALSQSLTSKHLRVLRDAGVVTVRVDGPRRVYRLNDRPLPDVIAWITPYYRRWSRGLNRLTELLEQEKDDAE
ncbi:ArsR/SmtB family transcription factor [Microlunatus parietis]|uniref:DNA-binding transcriptional ArsR family regulator n=1 Tax=Microlunatus parietis TaxID=682979 RepID=A0A7Y9ICK3_9ACTN|nr:metalloregulator ArsR/SmtB family transcription factor [Microlunatus parietis]NYE74319.1 DNA-binding transcriptional ArsR family regulator [Microlunatus parietis]